ncbi:hypothetical protein EsH8_II_000317 [Colletotrichum jinshuiense]
MYDPPAMRLPYVVGGAAAAFAASSQARGIVAPRAAGCTGGSWEDLAPIPDLPRQEHTAVAVTPTTVAILGGITGTTAAGAWNDTALVALYDVPTDTWRPAAPLPAALNHPNAAAVDGKIYLLGGLAEAHDANGTWRAVPDSWVYDPARDEWASLAPFPAGTERGSAAVGVHGTTIFLAGGLRYMETVAGGTIATVADVSAFDTAAGTWTHLPDIPLPQPRDHAGAAVVGGKLYVIGGRHIAGRLLVSSTVYVLDLGDVGAGWATSAAKMPTGRAGHGTAELGGLVYTFGGEGNLASDDGVFNQTEVFDPAAEAWASLKPMRLPRHGSAAVAVDGGIIIPGGGVAWGATPVDVTDLFRP